MTYTGLFSLKDYPTNIGIALFGRAVLVALNIKTGKPVLIRYDKECFAYKKKMGLFTPSFFLGIVTN